MPYLSRHFRVVVFDPRGNGRSDRPTRRRGLLLVGVRRRRPRRARGERRPGGARRRPLRRRRLGAHARRDRSGRRARRGRDRAVRAEADAVAPELPPVPVRRAARHRRGLGEVQRPLLAPRLPRLPRVLLRAAAPGAALDEADRGLRPLGARGRRGVARSSPTRRRRRRGGARRRRAAICEPGPLPRARDPRRPRQLPDARACGRRGRADAAGRSSRSRAPGICRRRATRSR